MSGYYFTSQDLIDSIKRRANIPDTQGMVTDDELLKYANEEMELNLTPLILSKHEAYLLTREDVPLIANTKEYAIPYRAVGAKLSNVAYTTDFKSFRKLDRIATQDITTNIYNNSNDNYSKYHLQNENIVLFTDENSISANGYLSIYFYLRPNSLVSSSRVASITAIDRTNGILTLDSLPDNFSLSSQFDFIQSRAPHKIITYDIDLLTIDSSNNYVTIDAEDIPVSLRIGDRLALAGETDVVNCPSELHVLLAQMVAARILESNGDLENLQAANSKLKKMETNSAIILDNRVENSPIKAKSRTGLLRGRRSSFRR